MTITANPLALDDETILERVLLIATRRRLPVHHVTIQDIEGRKSVALDLEVDGAMSLGDAHRLASELEDAIAEEIGEGVEVETHIEPAEPEASGQSAEPDLARRIEASLAATAAAQGSLRDIHNVRVRETPGGVIVLFHCRVDPATPVETVHDAVDSLERSVRAAFPEARRVVGHAEPARTRPADLCGSRPRESVASDLGQRNACAILSGAVLLKSSGDSMTDTQTTDNASPRTAVPRRSGSAAGSSRSSASCSSSSPPGSSGTRPGIGTAGRALRDLKRRTTPSSRAM